QTTPPAKNREVKTRQENCYFIIEISNLALATAFIIDSLWSKSQH
ncbi:MAG: hypothetical protein ACI823_000590, partial [Chitinophagales bacterium]